MQEIMSIHSVQKMEWLQSPGKIFKGWLFWLALFCFHEVVLTGPL